MDQTLARQILMQRLRANSSALPRRRYERNLGDSCGCAMGARFLAVALILSTAWYAWHWNASALSIWSVLLRVLIWSVVAAFVGKIVGILSFRRRRSRAT